MYRGLIFCWLVKLTTALTIPCLIASESNPLWKGTVLLLTLSDWKYKPMAPLTSIAVLWNSQKISFESTFSCTRTCATPLRS